MLPLEVDIFNRFKKRKEADVNAPNRSVALKYAEEVISLWKDRGNLPTLELHTVQLKVENIYSRGRDVLKISKERRDKMLADLDTEEDEPDGVKGIGRKKKKLDTFEKLFDISPIKHFSREDCDCPASQKVPAREFSFLLDQRTERQLVIASVDEKVTQAWQEAQQRKGKEEIFLKKEDTRQENVRKDIKRKRIEFLEAQV